MQTNDTAAGQKADARRKIIERILSLRRMTVENGCTLEEAKSAAEAAERIVARHQIAEAELDQSEGFQESEESPFFVAHPYPLPDNPRAIHTVIAVAGTPLCEFYSCKGFASGVDSVVIGQPQDVANVHALKQRVIQRSEALLREFRVIARKDPGWTDDLHHRTTASEFRKGYAFRILIRLLDEAEKGAPTPAADSDTTALVLHETDILNIDPEDVFDGLKLKPLKVNFRDQETTPFSVGWLAGELVRLFDYEDEPRETLEEAIARICAEPHQSQPTADSELPDTSRPPFTPHPRAHEDTARPESTALERRLTFLCDHLGAVSHGLFVALPIFLFPLATVYPRDQDYHVDYEAQILQALSGLVAPLIAGLCAYHIIATRRKNWRSRISLWECYLQDCEENASASQIHRLGWNVENIREYQREWKASGIHKSNSSLADQAVAYGWALSVCLFGILALPAGVALYYPAGHSSHDFASTLLFDHVRTATGLLGALVWAQFCISLALALHQPAAPIRRSQWLLDWYDGRRTHGES